MAKQTAGILVYRKSMPETEVLLVHPGGPYWKNKEAGAWSVPKGEYESGEDAEVAARREFEEETGHLLPEKELTALLPIRLKSGKILRVWTVEANYETPFIKSNYFEMEWPPKSGKLQSFEEVDKAAWFTLSEAAEKINQGQLNVLAQLKDYLMSTSFCKKQL